MRRKDREVTDQDWIWKVISDAEIMHLALIDPEGNPYAISAHYGFEREKNCLYIHSAMKGRKIEALKVHPNVAFNIIVGNRQVPRPGKPNHLCGIYKSVMGTAKVVQIEDTAEKLRIILKMKEHYGDFYEGYAPDMQHLQKVVNIYRLEIAGLTGKTKGYPNPDNPRAVVVKEALETEKV